MQGVRILWPNFSGEPGLYNKNGDRVFTILLEDFDQITELIKAGWNIKSRDPRDEGDVPMQYVEVKVNLDSTRPPEIFAIRGNTKFPLDRTTIGMLDNLPILEADLVLNPYEWVVKDSTGIKPYLVKGYFIIDQDEIDEKYEAMEYVYCKLKEEG
jgi:hypothetical protein